MIQMRDLRSPSDVKQWSCELAKMSKKPWTLMEVCGGQTHSILRHGLDTLVPSPIRFVHGPGCPVCVTPIKAIDAAIDLALAHRATICTYGDMLRVPGSSLSLADARALGGDIRVLTSPLHALSLAETQPRKEFVFFAIGFETTCPGTAALLSIVDKKKIENISVLMAHVRVLPMVQRIVADPDCGIHGLLAAGHVCAVTGYHEYHAIARQHSLPIVVTGFEPTDILRGIYQCVTQLENGETRVQNAYDRVVKEFGNDRALALMNQYVRVCDREWRGLGMIPSGGYEIRKEYEGLDAAVRFGYVLEDFSEDAAHQPQVAPKPLHDCFSGEILKGRMTPLGCPSFGKACRPEMPLGAPMVSDEGACAAYYRYKRSEIAHGL